MNNTTHVDHSDVNPEVSFSILTNVHDNSVTNWHTLCWSELVDFIEEQGHVVTEDKDVTLISPWKYKTTDDDFEPRTTVDGRLWTLDDEPVVGRYASNVVGTNMLMFDFDGSASINLMSNKFGDYMHFGYTSYSHMSPSKEHKDCFRIIVPLAQFVTVEQLIARRSAILADFQGVDKSCLSIARSFYVASVHPERKHLARMWKNDGYELFDVLSYDPHKYIPPTHSPSLNREVDHQRVIDALKKVYVGNEPEWYQVAVAMNSSGFTFADFCEVTIGNLMRQKDVRDCEKKWKSAERGVARGFTGNVGYLINLCKKHGAWERPTTAQRIAVIESKIAQMKGATQ